MLQLGSALNQFKNMAIQRVNREERNAPETGRADHIENQGMDYMSFQSSLFYAKRIQEAILPPKEFLSLLFKDSFLLHQPKDTISGDFYWFTKLGNKHIIAVCDCTGHGVPGAMISMLGYTILDEIVKTNGITDPGHILSRLDKAIRKLLKQGREGYNVNDGMDMAICTIDIAEKQLEYAGARRPLVICRKNSTAMIKGCKCSIGGENYQLNQNFLTHKLSYESGDNLYLFSDGYSDQFGGSGNKKMMQKTLINLLSSVQRLPMGSQLEVLSKHHLNWKGRNEQTDDILVIGVQL